MFSLPRLPSSDYIIIIFYYYFNYYIFVVVVVIILLRIIIIITTRCHFFIIKLFFCGLLVLDWLFVAAKETVESSNSIPPTKLSVFYYSAS